MDFYLLLLLLVPPVLALFVRSGLGTLAVAALPAGLCIYFAYYFLIMSGRTLGSALFGLAALGCGGSALLALLVGLIKGLSGASFRLSGFRKQGGLEFYQPETGLSPDQDQP